MKTPKERKIGEAFRAMVMPIKIKNGLPTIISVGGQMYTLLHRDQQPLRKTPPRREKEVDGK